MTDPVQNLRIHGRQIAELAASIRELCGDDDLAFIDTLDGETDAIQSARSAVRMVAAMETLEEAAKALASHYSARASDFGDRAQRVRDALAHFMGEIGEKKMVLPEGTVSLAAGSPSLVGEPAVETVPDRFVKVSMSIDRAAVRQALKDGEAVEGFGLSNAKPRLQIRTR